ncbi:MAG: GNAT family N-acetyltransferase [Micrococcales bacterium]|nr:MAG: GNAT family N-acetyltransferase [Micrococcales bacterium]
MSIDLEFIDDVGRFIGHAGDWMSKDPVRNTVIADVSHSWAQQPPALPAGKNRVPLWWLVVRDGDGAVAGAGMRTVWVPPYPIYLAAMPAGAGEFLAETLHRREERVEVANGFLRPVSEFAERTAALHGMSARPVMQPRLFEARSITGPPRPGGSLRTASRDDLQLYRHWYESFTIAADAQAGRRQETTHFVPPEDELGHHIDRGRVHFWCDPAGSPVSLVCISAPSHGVCRIGPVYTPDSLRGNGYAGAAVAELSSSVLARGHRVCLYVDQANPVSNELYERLGYRFVDDTVSMVIEA